MDQITQAECPHSIFDKQVALADGACPLCVLAAAREYANSYKMARVALKTLEEQRSKLTNALNTAMALTDALITELHAVVGPSPPHQVIQITVAKRNFDAAIKQLLDPLGTLT